MDEKKKKVVLAVLAVAAVLSLSYGIFTPSKIKRRKVTLLAAKPEGTIRQAAGFPVYARRTAKKSAYTSWGRNPFLLKKSKETRITLSGVLWDKERPKAIINGSIVGVGDRVGGNTVVGIREDAVILNDGFRDFELPLD